MKIAIFSDNFYPELSGITDSLLLLGEQLAVNGHKIMFVAPYYSHHDYVLGKKDKQKIKLHPNIIVFRLPSFHYPNSLTGQSRVVIPFGRAIAPLKKFQPDIIHTNSPFGTGLEAWLASKFLKVPLVGTNHTPIGEFISSNFFKSVALKYFVWYYNRCLMTTAPCRSLLNEMSKFGFYRKSLMVPNPVDLENFYPIIDEQQKSQLKCHFNLTKFSILYTGRLAKEKNVDIIIKAIAKVKPIITDVSLVIAGRGRFQDSLQSLTDNLKLQNHVKFLGMVDEKNFSKLYQASDLFVIMSVAESQSLSLMQAMACGLPVIGAQARALPEYINATNGLLVAPGDVGSLAEKIIYIFNNRDKALELGRGGVSSVQAYIAVVVAKQWEKIYSDIIKTYGAKT